MERTEKIRTDEQQPIWHFTSRNFRNMKWTNCGKYERAELPVSNSLYGRIVQLVEDFGGRNCSNDGLVSVEGIEILRNTDLITQFETAAKIVGDQQTTAFFKKKEADIVGDDEQKKTVMERVKAYRQRSAVLLNADEDELLSYYVTLHGCSEDAVDSICKYGAKDLRRTDPGYAGAGVYTTVQAEYAGLYSQMTGSSVMILCCCAASNIYPISRAKDYKAPYNKEYYGDRGAAHSCFFAGEGAALKPGFDAHWFCVTQPEEGSIVDVECYVPDDDSYRPCYDELVVKEEKQVLPIAIIRFGRSKDRRDAFRRSAA